MFSPSLFVNLPPIADNIASYTEFTQFHMRYTYIGKNEQYVTTIICHLLTQQRPIKKFQEAEITMQLHQKPR